ncbi:hypothetical protein STEG23_014617 [Scotinomys teguina]
MQTSPEVLHQDLADFRVSHPDLTLLQYVDNILLTAETEQECLQETEKVPLETEILELSKALIQARFKIYQSSDKTVKGIKGHIEGAGTMVTPRTISPPSTNWEQLLLETEPTITDWTKLHPEKQSPSIPIWTKTINWNKRDTLRHRHHLHQVEEEMSRCQCKKRQQHKDHMTRSEPSGSTLARPEHTIAEAKEINPENDFKKMREALKEEVKISLKELEEKANKKLEEVKESQEKSIKQMKETVQDLKIEIKTITEVMLKIEKSD